MAVENAPFSSAVALQVSQPRPSQQSLTPPGSNPDPVTPMVSPGSTEDAESEIEAAQAGPATRTMTDSSTASRIVRRRPPLLRATAPSL